MYTNNDNEPGMWRCEIRHTYAVPEFNDEVKLALEQCVVQQARPPHPPHHQQQYEMVYTNRHGTRNDGPLHLEECRVGRASPHRPQCEMVYTDPWRGTGNVRLHLEEYRVERVKREQTGSQREQTAGSSDAYRIGRFTVWP